VDVWAYEGQGIYMYASGDVYAGEYAAGRRHGRGKYLYASGDTYEGEYRQGKMEGKGTYFLSDGAAEVGRYKAGADVGEGVRWDATRTSACKLRAGKVVGDLTLDEAAKIAATIGLGVPPIVPPDDDDGEEEAAVTDEVDAASEAVAAMSLHGERGAALSSMMAAPVECA